MPRVAIVEKEKCHPEECGNFLCVRLCPVNRNGDECIVKAGKARINEELCIGCQICAKRCPFEAIHIINLPEEFSHEPIHKYGPDQFRIYSLPTPQFGKVVGIIGKNGIGKTTALQIIAGMLKPNFGKETEASYEELIQRFKGTEAQNFFEKLKGGKIRVSYKPQQVDMIPEQYRGKVIELLKKVDEKNRLDEIIEKLELKEILENKVNEISGGELQRVAIAATVLKKANLYIFDEPTSYLDIKQRLKVAKFIRGLADENTAVLLVEHDLIILDYMADLVHIMYGKPVCYGVCSLPKATKAGLNIYLSGYIKEENMRFRDYEIKFEKSPAIKQASSHIMVSWQGITKRLGKFWLEAKKGEIHKNSVVGVLGENGIGKTSFVKILAGALKADTGKIDQKVTVSYKPQYLKSDSKEAVANVLRDAIAKYSSQLILPLEIKPLLAQQVNELSGGELQRVAIAKALSEDAQLFLLDEPSAYLDVEQRLKVSKIIREFMEQKGTAALIVDHDLLFIDYLSHQLLVFDGAPAIKGEAKGPFDMEEGMNLFLRDIGLSFRRDEESHRPRANKPGSVKDREQKEAKKLYYT